MRPIVMMMLTTMAAAHADQTPLRAQLDTHRGDAMIADYFRLETRRVADADLKDIRSLEDWNNQRHEHRLHLMDMLGLNPEPPRSDLKPVVTGVLERPEFTVQKLHFQSLPGLYVTANLYLPRNLTGPAPAVLYVCGHSQQLSPDKKISYGNKAGYQHHGEWYARNGYVCLIIDTLQLGEIQGLHHGTHRLGLWWWHARGYTPAGVEVWNGIRALDYLESRPEVDKARIGLAGRSGGGGYTMYLAAVDDRVAAAAPAAGVTDLQNHIVDGVVAGHCDCMYQINTQRWDWAHVLALIAPRPLRILNTDMDAIFPEDGVRRVHDKTRFIYRLHLAEHLLDLKIEPGPHKDTPELQNHEYHWMNTHLKRHPDAPLGEPARTLFQPAELRVFGPDLPAEQINTSVHQTFITPAPPPPLPEQPEHWPILRDRWLHTLREQVFAGWPADTSGVSFQLLRSVTRHGLRLSTYQLQTQPGIVLDLHLLHRADLARPETVVLHVQDEHAWAEWLTWMTQAFDDQFPGVQIPGGPDWTRFVSQMRILSATPWAMAYLCPRGIGPTRWTTDPKTRSHVHIERRFPLLGQTLDGMRAWDVRAAVAALSRIESLRTAPLWLRGDRQMAGVALYAAIFEPGVARLDLHEPTATHHDGPMMLNVLRYLDLPQAVALAADRRTVRLHDDQHEWAWPRQLAARLAWPDSRLQLTPATRP
jgi:dienelactone hydrolase